MTPLTVSTSNMDQISHQEMGLIQYEDRDFRETTVCVLTMSISLCSVNCINLSLIFSLIFYNFFQIFKYNVFYGCL